MPLHPQTQQYLERLAAQGAPGWASMGPHHARQGFAALRQFFGRSPAMHREQDIHLDTCTARIFYPTAEPGLPVVMYFHGGGWVLGDLETHSALCRQLAACSRAAVVAVDYRRAPEAPYPAALDDCTAATQYVAGHAGSLSLDATRLALAGDSAGGHLALGVAQRFRDQGLPLRYQVLIYPVIEPNFTTSSYLDFATGYGLTRETMQWFWQQYAGAVLSSSQDPHLVPTRATSLAGLPATHIVTAEYDVLRDEGEAFAQRLRRDGVPTTVRRYEGVIHGFVHFSGVFDLGRQAIADIGAVLREKLHA